MEHVKLQETKSEEWKVVKLGEIASSIKGKRPDKLYDTEENGLIPYINIKAFETGEFDHFTTGKECRLCNKGDLLIVWDGSRSGLVGRAYEGAICSTIAKIDIEGVLNNYGYYFLLSNYQYLNTNTKGSGTPHVDPDLLWDLEIPVPPKEVQKRIVEKIEELFSDLDNGIENLQKAKQQLETYKQSVLKAAFEGKLTKQWREQQEDMPTPEELKTQSEGDYEHYRKKELSQWREEVKQWEEEGEPGKKPWKPRRRQSLDPISKEEINKAIDIPDNWAHLRLQKLGKEIFDGPFGSNLKTKDYTDEGVRVIRLENIDWLNFKNEHKTYVSEEKYEEIKKHTVYHRDIIFASFISDSTRVTVLPKLIEKAVNKADCFCIRTFENVNPYYLCFYLATNHAYNQLSHKVHGATRPRVNTTQLKETVVPVCSKEEQDQIVNEIESRLSIIDQLDETIKEELKKSKALHQSILKKAFEGKLLS